MFETNNETSENTLNEPVDKYFKCDQCECTCLKKVPASQVKANHDNGWSDCPTLCGDSQDGDHGWGEITSNEFYLLHGLEIGENYENT